MTPDEIRALPIEAVEPRGMRSMAVTPMVADCAVILREIAAQLAEHNAHMARLEWLAENVISLNCGGLQVKVNQ